MTAGCTGIHNHSLIPACTSSQISLTLRILLSRLRRVLLIPVYDILFQQHDDMALSVSSLCPAARAADANATGHGGRVGEETGNGWRGLNYILGQGRQARQLLTAEHSFRNTCNGSGWAARDRKLTSADETRAGRIMDSRNASN